MVLNVCSLLFSAAVKMLCLKQVIWNSPFVANQVELKFQSSVERGFGSSFMPLHAPPPGPRILFTSVMGLLSRKQVSIPFNKLWQG